MNDRPFTTERSPMREVGALLDAKDVHGGRSAGARLRALAQSNGIPSRVVDEVLDLVGRGVNRWNAPFGAAHRYRWRGVVRP